MLKGILKTINKFLDKPLLLNGLFNKGYHSATNPNTGKAFFIIYSPSRPNTFLNPRSGKPLSLITNIDAAFLFTCEEVCKRYGKILTQPNFKAWQPIKIICVPHGYFDQKKFSRFAGDPQRGKRQALTVTRRVAAPVILIYPEMFPEWIAHELVHVAEELYDVPLKQREEGHDWTYFMEDQIAAYLSQTPKPQKFQKYS